jgi:hypothetical protein
MLTTLVTDFGTGSKLADIELCSLWILHGMGCEETKCFPFSGGEFKARVCVMMYINETTGSVEIGASCFQPKPQEHNSRREVVSFFVWHGKGDGI